MDAMGRIAGKRQTRRDEGARECQPQRIGTAILRRADLTELMAEAALKLSLEHQIVGSHHAIGICGPLGPDKR